LQPLLKGATSGAAIASSSTPGMCSWLLDSGASFHMTPHKSILSECQSNSNASFVSTADGTALKIEGVGTFKNDLSKHNKFYIPKIRLIPKLHLNLLSVSQISDHGYDVIFSSSKCWVQDRQSGKLIGEGSRQGDLYYMDFLCIPKESFCNTAQTKDIRTWHHRLGHPNIRKLNFVPVTKNLCKDNFECKECLLGKMTALPYGQRTFYSSMPFELVHSDVWGPAPVASKGGFSYYVVFIDDFTRYCWIYFLKFKSDVFATFKTFHNMIKNQFESKIKILRTDSGGEYLSNEFKQFLENEGILHQKSCPRTPQQNGISERKHRHIMKTTRTLLIARNVPKNLWAEAALTAVYLINRMSSKTLSNEIPFEKLFKYQPDYQRLRIFGCKCYVLNDKGDKLSSKAIPCAFIGYSETQKGFKCYDIKNDKLLVSRNVNFVENESGFEGNTSQDINFDYSFLFKLLSNDENSYVESPIEDRTTVEPIVYTRRNQNATNESVNQSNNEALEIPSEQTTIRRSERTSRIPNKFVSYDSFSPRHRACLIAIHSYFEPSCYNEAKNLPEWKKAMHIELDALKEANTWEILNLPIGKKTIGCRWVFKVKTKSDGSLERHKARLVAKGYSQEYGVDYEETFAPVARMTTVRMLVAISAIKNWNIFQMDVKNAFLNGNLNEEVYMDVPPGLIIPSGKVLKLKKALYGLKQAPKAWFDTFNNVIARYGFKPCYTDTTLFIKNSSAGIIILLLYVDDMLITGSDKEGIKKVKQF
jgi:hypothetical protein